MRSTARRAALLVLAASVAACAAPARQGRPPEPDRSRVPPLGPPPALALPPQVRFTLPNGLRVRLVEYRRLPVVALHLVVDAGAVHDPPDRPGLASLTAAMLTEGTAGRSATRISDELGAIGAHLGGGAGYDAAQLSGASLVKHLDALLDLFADVLRRPAFPAADFARVQDQRLVGLLQQRDQPGTVASKALAALYWGSHPYGRWLGGTEESLRALGPPALAAFHAARWRPGNAELVVVGDVARADLEPRLARALEGWTGGAAPAASAQPPAPRPPRTLLVEKKGAPQTFLLLGMPGLSRSDPDYAAAEVAFQILGGGTSSRLFRHLREEKGYTYGISARAEARRLGGLSVIGGNVKGDQTGLALRALLDELADLRDRPASAEELRGARDGLVLSLPSDFATAGAIASRLAEAVVHGLPDDHWARHAEAVGKVSAADVQRVAGRLLDASHLTAVLVGDPAAVEPQLAGLPLGSLERRPAARAAN